MKKTVAGDLRHETGMEFRGGIALPGSEVPTALTREILAAARKAGTARRRARLLRRFSPFAAAAALLLVFGIFQFRQGEPQQAAGNEEMLALLDWSKLEQESYNLTSELSSRQLTMNQWH